MKRNKGQEEAILHNEGPMIVLAGPGSGKTFVITERTKCLMEEHGISQDKILVITFTKAAALEMKERFERKEGMANSRVNFGTFHGIFFAILKNAYGYSGRNIIRPEVKFQLFKDIIRDLNLEYEDEKEFIADITSEISLVKGEKMDINNYYSTSCGEEVFREIYNQYNEKLKQSKLIDFDDMLLITYNLLKTRKDILKMWQERFQYILIDEFQDINTVQYNIITMLSQPEDNLFIVGDDDQSIYRFRGAKPEIMMEFQNNYKDTKQILLDKNYRSTSTIVDLALKLVSNNKNRFPKKVNAVKDKGEPVSIMNFDNVTRQNDRVAKQIREYQGKGLEFSEISILVRGNMGNGSLIHKLMEYNIPFKMKGSLPNLYEHWIAQDIIAYIDIAEGSTLRADYLRIINRPNRYIRRDNFTSPEVDFEEIKENYIDKKWMYERLEMMEYDLGLISNMSPYAAITYIRKGISYEEHLKEYARDRQIKPDELLSVLDELQEGAREFKTFKAWYAHMESYGEELKKQAMQEEDYDAITIATMHGSKGLEFQVVFIVDANEGIMPHEKAIMDADIEEERRLFYVAMTRAKENLHIYSSNERYNKTMKTSRFVDEILADEKKYKA